jgi:membrane protein
MRRVIQIDFIQILKRAAYEWYEDKVPRMAAALAFYTVFSLTPIVVIAIAVGGTLFGRERALEALLDQAKFLVGDDGTNAIKLVIENAPPGDASIIAMIIGIGMMIFAATGAFAELKDSLDTIWEVRPKPGLSLLAMARDRFLSFALVLVIVFLLLVSLVVSAILAALHQRLTHYFGEGLLYLINCSQIPVSFAVVTFLFALIYKVLPDAQVAWKDVWLGAGLASILFSLGKFLFGLYLGHSTLGTSYGAAGSLVVVVLWTYYAALILLFGAEVSQAQARIRGERIVPTENALHITEHGRVQEGIPRLSDVERIAKESEAASVNEVSDMAETGASQR